ncbi:hypothetical protein BGY98DRAFT_991632, partial [Russula aff. rugulosa BPL654]
MLEEHAYEFDRNLILAASCNGVLPLSSSVSTFAPCSRSARTTSIFPFSAAISSGVELHLVRAFTSAPCSSNMCASSAFLILVTSC